MEKQIKVGNYVRTKRGQIGKVEKICEKHIEIEFNRMWKDLILKENIIKSSSNIIDLIEVGDYINGTKVKNINGNLFNDDGEISEIIIKSIVTKEHFESIEYEVGE